MVRRNTQETELTPEQEAAIIPPKHRGVSKKHSSSGGGRHPLVWGIVAIFVVGALVSLASNFLARASVVITPKTDVVTLDHNLTAVKSGTEGKLHFETMTLAVSDTKSIPATGRENVSKKATGTMTVQNNYSNKSQNLVAGTRFKAPNGKIYRANKAFTVPGMSKVDGANVAGTVDIAVTADASGESYNQGPAQFTIPGFIGSPKYEKITGVSKADMVGGFEGEINVASEADVAAARTELESSLNDRVTREAASQIPEGFIAYPSTFITTFSDTYGFGTTASATADTVAIKGTAQLRGVVLKTSELSTFIAEYSPEPYDGSPIEVPDLAGLVLTIRDSGLINFDTATTLTLHLAGTAHVTKLIDREKLANALAGTPKSSQDEIFRTFPEIVKADTNFLPAWVRRYPDDASRISIQVQAGK